MTTTPHVFDPIINRFDISDPFEARMLKAELKKHRYVNTLKGYIAQHSGSKEAGLASSALVELAADFDVAKRDEVDLEELERTQKQRASPLEALAEASAIAGAEEHGFYAYKADYVHGLHKQQGRFANVTLAEGNRGRSLQNAKIDAAIRNYEDSLKRAEARVAEWNGGSSLQHAKVSTAKHNYDYSLNSATVDEAIENAGHALMFAIVKDIARNNKGKALEHAFVKQSERNHEDSLYHAIVLASYKDHGSSLRQATIEGNMLCADNLAGKYAKINGSVRYAKGTSLPYATIKGDVTSCGDRSLTAVTVHGDAIQNIGDTLRDATIHGRSIRNAKTALKGATVMTKHPLIKFIDYMMKYRT